MPIFSGEFWKFKQITDSINFDHFLALTDETGMLQHAKFSIPDRRLGYTTDDNARALVISTREYALESDMKWSALAGRFLAFLIGMQRPDGRLHNFMSYTREVGNDLDSGDHLGRVLWATGCVLDSPLPPGFRASAKEVFDKALPWALQSTSLRVKAHAIKGLSRYVSRFGEDLNARQNLSHLVKQLVATYKGNCSDDWEWFENILSYENWRLPESLFEAYLFGENCLGIANATLSFLRSVEFRDDMLIPVGSEGWYPRNLVRAEFDQLPVEAGSAVEALAVAAEATGSSQYSDLALQALRWYHGWNLKGVTVYDARSGACCDGISPAGLNMNKGAESTLSYLLAATRLELMFLHGNRL
jgi:hypothetical protein